LLLPATVEAGLAFCGLDAVFAKASDPVIGMVILPTRTAQVVIITQALRFRLILSLHVWILATQAIQFFGFHGFHSFWFNSSCNRPLIALAGNCSCCKAFITLRGTPSGFSFCGDRLFEVRKK
jgi:hypothetical protein